MINFLFFEYFLKFIDLKSFHSVWIIIKSENLIASFNEFEKDTLLNFEKFFFGPVGS